MSVDIPIIFEDEDVLVVNKPAGIVVNQAETTQDETVQGILATRLPHVSEESWQALVPADFDPQFGSPAEIFAQRQGMVHRLDKNTSGVLVWAKNPGSLVHLLKQFRTRTVSKTYTALVHGKVAAPKATLTYPIGRASRDRKLFAVVAEGRPAVTEYEVQQQFDHLNEAKIAALVWPQLEHGVASDSKFLTSINTAKELGRRLSIYQGFTLLKCKPLTGRTHQIRVHLAHVRHPIVGDVTYLGRKRAVLDPLWCPRQFLHASTLEITHPRTGEKVQFEAPLATELVEVLSLFQE